MLEKERHLRQVIARLLAEREATASVVEINEAVSSLLQLTEFDWNSINESLYHLPPWRIINEAVSSTEADYWIKIIGGILKGK